MPEGSATIGRSLIELSFPTGALVVLIRRRDDVLVPRGSTQIERGDTLLVLAERAMLDRIRALVAAVTETDTDAPATSGDGRSARSTPE